LYALWDQVNEHVRTAPTVWLKVRDVAEWYYQHFQKARNGRAAKAILNPLGLDHESFIVKQNQLDSTLVNKLASELVNFSVPEIEAIITGVDGDGPHIYVADNNGVESKDSVGFAAIGAGYWHANSQMMFAEHARWKPMPAALFLTYAAKRRAEVAPGVGEVTDMLMIGPDLGTYFMVGDHVLNALNKIYQDTRERAKESHDFALSEVNAYVKELTSRQAEAATGGQITQQPALPEPAATEAKPPTAADEAANKKNS
jgi:hypothetical protein